MLLLVFIMLVFTSISTSVATGENNQSNNKVFSNCYIDILGSLETQWKICFMKPFGDYRSTVFYWHLELQSDSDLVILSEKDGEILYQHHGAIVVNIALFSGIYIPSKPNENEPLQMDIDGHAGRISITTKDQASQEKVNQVPLPNRETFTGSYIEIQGHVHNDWPAIIKLPNMIIAGWVRQSEEEILFGSYSYILFEEDASIRVYDEKGGNLLWKHQGTIDPLITLIGFRGSYNYVDIELTLRQVTLEGTALFTSIRLHDYGYD